MAERQRAARSVEVANSESGASAVEYCVLVFGVAATIAIFVFAFGPVAAHPWTSACTAINAAATMENNC